MDIYLIEPATASTAERTNDLAQARLRVERAIERDPADIAAWLSLSKLMPTTEQALRCIEQVLHLDPHHVRAREAKAMAQMQLLVEEAAVVATTAPIPSTDKRRYLLGEALVAAGLLTIEQLTVALQEQARLDQRQQPQRLGEILLRLRFVRPADLEAALVQQIARLSLTIADRGTGLFGAFLVRHDFITPEQLQQGLAQQTQLQQRGVTMLLGEVLVGSGYLQRAQLNHALITWQQWYQRAASTRDDPYAAAVPPALTTRSGGLRQRWQRWTRRLRRQVALLGDAQR